MIGRFGLALWFACAFACALVACGGDDSANAGSGGKASSGGAGAGGSATGGKGNGGSSTGGSSAGGSSNGGSAGGGGVGGVGGTCSDTCAAPNGGISYGCEKRFMYGVNYAWHNFAGDFGGIGPWGQKGVSGDPNVYLADLKDMRAHGASVIRWWVFPDFRGDGVEFDSAETATGLSATAIADVQKALDLAAQADVFLMLTIFSFDNFSPSKDVAGIWVPGMAPMVRDATKRKALIDHVVTPLAKTVAASPNASRVIAWDLINEPEWALKGASLYGDPDFASNPDLDPVTHTELEVFLKETAAALRAESKPLVSVGGAAAKWAKAWTGLGLDFYQFHIYEWVNAYWPYSDPASKYGLDKPLVMGEMPMGDLTAGVSYQTVVQSFWDTGYAGALSWQYDEATSADLDKVKSFADLHACETSYSQPSADFQSGPSGSRWPSP